jgi:hypothetical protein
MQNIKDTFYIALRDRLAALNPARVVTIRNVTRPAVVVAENEAPDSQPLLPDTFHLFWRESEAITARPLRKLRCEIVYWVEGSETISYQDRGRALGLSDEELLAICTPPRTPLMDHAQSPAVTLGGNIFWSTPLFAAPKIEGRKLVRSAFIDVFAAGEVAAWL